MEELARLLSRVVDVLLHSLYGTGGHPWIYFYAPFWPSTIMFSTVHILESAPESKIDLDLIYYISKSWRKRDHTTMCMQSSLNVAHSFWKHRQCRFRPAPRMNCWPKMWYELSKNARRPSRGVRRSERLCNESWKSSWTGVVSCWSGTISSSLADDGVFCLCRKRSHHLREWPNFATRILTMCCLVSEQHESTTRCGVLSPCRKVQTACHPSRTSCYATWS